MGLYLYSPAVLGYLVRPPGPFDCHLLVSLNFRESKSSVARLFTIRIFLHDLSNHPFMLMRKILNFATTITTISEIFGYTPIKNLCYNTFGNMTSLSYKP